MTDSQSSDNVREFQNMGQMLCQKKFKIAHVSAKQYTNQQKHSWTAVYIVTLPDDSINDIFPLHEQCCCESHCHTCQ